MLVTMLWDFWGGAVVNYVTSHKSIIYASSDEVLNTDFLRFDDEVGVVYMDMKVARYMAYICMAILYSVPRV